MHTACSHSRRQHDLLLLQRRSCRDKFVTLRFWTDPTQAGVLGFKCSNCGFECDVPGKIEFNKENKEFEMKVDSQHKFCQNCGTPSR
jgi:hypothetical protein